MSFIKKENSVENQVLELIRLEPGIKSTDIYSLLDQYSSNNVSGRVTTLFQSGKIVRKEHTTGNNQRTYRYWLRKDAPAGAEGFKPKMKMKTPTWRSTRSSCGLVRLQQKRTRKMLIFSCRGKKTLCL